jgi:hypothetical protein
VGSKQAYRRLFSSANAAPSIVIKKKALIASTPPNFFSSLRSISFCHHFTPRFLVYDWCFYHFPHIQLKPTNQFSGKLISWHLRPLQNCDF